MLDIPAGAPAASTLPNLATIKRCDEDRRGPRARLPPRELFELSSSNGPTFTPPDFRFQTTLANAGICNQLPTIE